MEHLSEGTLNALADGELSPDQMSASTAHLAECSACTTSALAQMMLKQAVAKAGDRYALPDAVRSRLAGKVNARPDATLSGWKGWAVAAALILSVLGVGLLRYGSLPAGPSMTLATEVTDQHVATITANAAPEVLSSDRHTVKPWFQGKIPFSFNVPEALPDDTTLDGANLTYIGHRPVAQLLYSIGKHRVSVFLMEKAGSSVARATATRSAGFHIVASQTSGLDIVAVSDVELSKLQALTTAIDEAQQ